MIVVLRLFANNYKNILNYCLFNYKKQFLSKNTEYKSCNRYC